VYKLLKDMYGLKKAPRAWYIRIKTFLVDHGYVMGSVDKTLFTLKHGNDFLLVQIYVDDISFGGSSHVLVSSFQEMVENEFQMLMMGELTFFLGIQVKQIKQGTFVHQAKYTNDLIKKFNMAELKPVSKNFGHYPTGGLWKLKLHVEQCLTDSFSKTFVHYFDCILLAGCPFDPVLLLLA
jgi:hypothetical protein